MTSSITIARIRGIDIGINWSWLAIVGLIGWSLAAAVFPDLTPGRSDLTYVLMAIVATLLFFTSLLLHELGHAIQAQREGMKIEGITLWIFGGVAKFSGMFPSAEAEFRVAVAGPVVTLAIGLLTLGIYEIPGLPEAVAGVVQWLSIINFALLIFNMLPAFPMDGGRVLRALIWRRNRDFPRSTEIAGAVGRAFGQVFIFGGIFLFLATGAFGGAWLALIGWFVINAGQAEVKVARMRTAFAGRTAADLMVAAPQSVSPELTIEQFLEQVLPVHRYRAYPVVRDGHAVGLLSSRAALTLPRRAWPATTVEQTMVPLDKALVFAPEKDLGEAAMELIQTEPGRGLVVGPSGIAGLISITDVVRALELPSAVAVG
ncbi:MAG: site-2 protease family protein [Actinobacteria bacterium]|nr:site-2 protease family protein [Actinomycetota bacterium]